MKVLTYQKISIFVNSPTSHLENSWARPSDCICSHIWPSKDNFKERQCPSRDSTSLSAAMSLASTDVSLCADIIHNSVSKVLVKKLRRISDATDSEIVCCDFAIKSSQKSIHEKNVTSSI